MTLANALRHPIETYVAFKENFRRQSPVEKWQYLLDIARIVRWIGIYILEAKNKVNLRTALPGLALAHYYVCLPYTIYLYRNNVMRALQPLCIIGIAIPTAISYSFIIVPAKADTFQSLIFFGGNHIYPMPTENGKLRKAYDAAAMMLVRTTIWTMVAITLSSITFAIYPLYTYILENAHPMTIPIIIPYTDPDTDFGYYLNVMIQLCISFFGILSNMGIEYVNMTMVNSVWVGVSSVQCALDEFSDFIKHEPYNTLDTKYRLRTILMRIRDMDRYIVVLTDFYYWKLLLQPLLITFSVSMSIFCQMMANWSSGYGCALYQYTQLIILCYMGHVVDIANERLSTGLWNIPWYLLPPLHQKMLQTILHRIQNGARLTIGPFAKLNLETATNLTKFIYKFLMVLMRFAD